MSDLAAFRVCGPGFPNSVIPNTTVCLEQSMYPLTLGVLNNIFCLSMLSGYRYITRRPLCRSFLCSIL